MAGYRYRGRPFLSQANRDIMAERSALPEAERVQREAQIELNIREYPYIRVRPLTSADVVDGDRGSAPSGNRPPSTRAES